MASNRFFTARYMALCDKANLRPMGAKHQWIYHKNLPIGSIYHLCGKGMGYLLKTSTFFGAKKIPSIKARPRSLGGWRPAKIRDCWGGPKKGAEIFGVGNYWNGRMEVIYIYIVTISLWKWLGSVGWLVDFKTYLFFFGGDRFLPTDYFFWGRELPTDVPAGSIIRNHINVR